MYNPNMPYSSSREWHARNLASIYLKELWTKYRILKKAEAHAELKKRMGLELIEGCPIATMNEEQAHTAQREIRKILWDSRDENDNRCFTHIRGCMNYRSIGWINCQSDSANYGFMTSYRILEDGYLLTGYDTADKQNTIGVGGGAGLRITIQEKIGTFHFTLLPRGREAVLGTTGIIDVASSERQADEWYKNRGTQ